MFLCMTILHVAFSHFMDSCAGGSQGEAQFGRGAMLSLAEEREAVV
jgi:hypothetical protein